MKKLFLFLFIITAYPVFAAKEFRVLRAEREHWVAGAKGMGSGTEYSLTVVICTRKPIHFDSLWINSEALEIKTVQGSVYSPHGTLVRGDTVRLRSSEEGTENIGAKKIEEHKNASVAPKKYSGDALLGYSVGTIKKYFVVKHFTKKTSPNRP